MPIVGEKLLSTHLAAGRLSTCMSRKSSRSGARPKKSDCGAKKRGGRTKKKEAVSKKVTRNLLFRLFCSSPSSWSSSPVGPLTWRGGRGSQVSPGKGGHR